MGGTTLKFVVGQTVELINGDSFAAYSGATAVVESIGRRYIRIVWKRDSKWNNQGNGGYYPKDFKLKHICGEQLLFSFMGE